MPSEPTDCPMPDEVCAECGCRCCGTDPEIERILTMPDDDLLAEALARGEDVHEIAERGRALFREVLARHAGGSDGAPTQTERNRKGRM